jgi:fructokinase
MNKPMIFSNKPHDILLIGEVLVDRIKDQTTTKQYFGGSPGNITVNLSRLGFHPILLSSIGQDNDGDYLEQFLVEEGIDLSFVRRSLGPTSKVLINQTAGSPEPVFVRGSDTAIHYSQEIETMIKKCKMMHFSYWPLSENPSKETVLKAIKVAKNAGVVIGFDPNYHPDLISENSIKLNELIELMSFVDIMKPSLDDAKRLFGEGYSIEDYMQKFLDAGVRLVVMTLGKEGLIAAYENQIVEMPSMADEVVDATGAGDAFWSGLYAGLLSSYSIHESLEMGLACSAFNLRSVGAMSDLPIAKDLAKEYKIKE